MEKNVLDEIMAMAEYDPEELNYIRQQIGPETSQKYDDEILQYIVDVIFEYIDQKGEEEEIIVDDVAQYVVAAAAKEKIGKLDINEVSDIVDADLDYMENG